MNVVYRDKAWEFENPLTVVQMLQRIDVLPESVLVICNGKLVAEDRTLNPTDEVRVVDVISGG